MPRLSSRPRDIQNAVMALTDEQLEIVAPVVTDSFTIDRSEWLRGVGAQRSALLRLPLPSDSPRKDWFQDADNNEDIDKRCCVGVYGQHLGFPDDKLANKGWPKREDGLTWPEWLMSTTLYHNQRPEAILSLANDQPVDTPEDYNDGVFIVSEEMREKLIARIFRLNGVEVTFVN